MESFLSTQQAIKGLEQEIEEVRPFPLFSACISPDTRRRILDRLREVERKLNSVLLHHRNKWKREARQSRQVTMIRKNG
jgi:hypothetical protein